MFAKQAPRALSGLLALALMASMCPAAGLAYAAEGGAQQSVSTDSTSGTGASSTGSQDRVSEDVSLDPSAGSSEDSAGSASAGSGEQSGGAQSNAGPQAEGTAANSGSSSDGSARYTGSASGQTSADVSLDGGATVGTIEHGGLAYTINEDDTSSVSVTGLASSKPAGDVQIPAQITNGGKLYAVTGIKVPGLADDANPYAEDLFDDDAKALAVKAISIPQSVETIEPAFFQLFPNATDIDVSDDNPVYTSYDGAIYSTDLTKLILVPQGRGSLVLPQSLAVVPAYAFSQCDKLSAISFPGSTGNDFLAVRNNVLYTNDLTTLLAAPAGLGASVSIAAECTTIAEGAFFGNAALDTIVVNGVVEGIASAGDSATGADGQPLMGGSAVDGSTLPAFDGATVENATVVINVSAEADGDEAAAMIERAKAAWVAYGFTNFKEPAVPGTEIVPEQGSGFAFTLLPDYTLSVRWAGSTEPPAAIDIPDYGIIDGVQYTVSAIADNAFSNYTSLITVDIPQTVTSIGDSAFELCTSLQTVHFDSVVSIGAKAFANTALLSLVLPTTVQSIGDNAFSNMKGTTIVALGSIADNSPIALGAASSLDVYVPCGTEDAWDAGIPTLGNHIYPYGVKLSDEPLELEVGQTANIKDSGYIEAPGAIETNYAYKANPVSINTDDGTIEAKAAGSTYINVSLQLTIDQVAVKGNVSNVMKLQPVSADGEEESDIVSVPQTISLAAATMGAIVGEEAATTSSDGTDDLDSQTQMIHMMVDLSTGRAADAETTNGNYVFLQGKYVATSGALPTMDDPNNKDASKAGWQFETATGTLRIWSAENVSVAGLWASGNGSGDNAYGDKYWSPLRSSVDELQHYVETTPEGTSFATRFSGLGGNVKAVDTTDLSGAENMAGWFAGMDHLTDITMLRIPDGSKGGQVPLSLSRMLSYTGVTNIPAGFYIPDGVVNLHCMLTCAEDLTDVYASFSLPDRLEVGSNGSLSALTYNAIFMGCTSLKAIPRNIFSRITSEDNLPKASLGITGSTKNIASTHLFVGCSALETMPEGFSLPKGRFSTTTVMFGKCDSLTYIPSSFSLSCTDVDCTSMFKSDYAGREKYDGLVTYWAGTAATLNSAMVPSGISMSAADYWSTNYGRVLKIVAGNVATVDLNVRKATASNQGTEDDYELFQTIPIKDDGTIANPGAPYAGSYMFKGWFADPELTQPFFAEDTLNAESLAAPSSGKLYAQYIQVSGALPTTDDANNTNSAKAGWLFDTNTHTLRIWSEKGVSVKGLWSSGTGSGDNANGDDYWGPLRSTKEELKTVVDESPETLEGGTRWGDKFAGLGGNVQAVDTSGLSGAETMAGWFASMYDLKDISRLVIPDGSEGATDASGNSLGAPKSLSRLLTYSGIESVPSSFYIPDGVTNVHCLFSSANLLKSVNEGFSLPDGTSVSYAAVFMGCHSLTMLPSTLFSRIASAEDYLAAHPEATSARNISLERIFCGCRLLETLPEGFSIPLDRVREITSAFAENHSLTFLPSSFRLDSLIKIQGFDSAFTANYKGTEKYDDLATYWAGNASELDQALVYVGYEGTASEYWLEQYGRILSVDSSTTKVNINVRRAQVNPIEFSDSNLVQRILVASDGTIQNPGIPYASSYMFEGWFSDPELTQKVFDAADDPNLRKPAPESGALYAEYVQTSGALPIVNSAGNTVSNDNPNLAGWEFNTETKTLRIWSASGVTVGNLWPIGDYADGNQYWGPLRSSEEELKHHEETCVESSGWATKFAGLGGDVRAIDTSGLSGAATMNGWFAGMDQLKDITKFRIPDGSKGGNIPTDMTRAFSYCGIENIPAGFYIPNGIKSFHCIFTGADQLKFIYDDFSFPEAISNSGEPLSSVLFTGFFMGCTSLTNIPSKLLSRIASADDYAKMFNKTVTTKNIGLGYIFCGCVSLASVPEGLSIPKGRATTVAVMFANCDSLTYLPASLRLDALDVDAASMFKADYKGTTKYDNLTTYWAGAAADLNTAMTPSNISSGANDYWQTNYGRNLMTVPSNNVTFFTQRVGLNTGWDYFMGVKDASNNVTIPKTKAQLEEVGYEFLGWYADGDGINQIASADATMIANPPSSVYGRYGAIFYYSLSLDFNEGVEEEYPTQYTVEANAIRLPNPSRDGYDFAGWVGTGLTAATKDLVIPRGSVGDREYTATWTPIQYTINFQPNGGTGDVIERSNLTYDGAAAASPSATEATTRGYTLVGWSTDASGDVGSDGIYLDPEDEISVKDLFGNGLSNEVRSIDFYAQWEAHPYTIEVNAYADGTLKTTATDKKVTDDDIRIVDIINADDSIKLSGYAATSYTYDSRMVDPNDTNATTLAKIKASSTAISLDDLITWVEGDTISDIALVEGERTIKLYVIWSAAYSTTVPMSCAKDANYSIDLAKSSDSIKANNSDTGISFLSKTRQALEVDAYAEKASGTNGKTADKLFGGEDNLTNGNVSFAYKSTEGDESDEFNLNGGSSNSVHVASLDAYADTGEAVKVDGTLMLNYKDIDFSQAIKENSGAVNASWDDIANIRWQLSLVGGTARKYLFANASAVAALAGGDHQL